MKKTKTLRMAQLGLLTAIILVMAFTPLGYMKLFVIDISEYLVGDIYRAVAGHPDNAYSALALSGADCGYAADFKQRFVSGHSHSENLADP